MNTNYGSDRFRVDDGSRRMTQHIRNLDDAAFTEMLRTNPEIDQLLDNFRKPNNRRVILEFFRRMYEVVRIDSGPIQHGPIQVMMSSRIGLSVRADPTNPAYSPTARWLGENDHQAFDAARYALEQAAGVRAASQELRRMSEARSQQNIINPLRQWWSYED